MILVLLLFMTDIFDSIFNIGIANGYEGALARLLKIYLLCALSSLASVILGINLLRQRKIKLSQLIIMSAVPPIILTIFTVILLK